MAEPRPVWVYAVLAGTAPAPPPGLTGVAGEPVRVLRRDALAAAVGTLPASLAGEQQLRRRLHDPRWLERAARSHHHVVNSLFSSGTAVPFRLATVYHDDERVRELLGARGPALVDALGAAADRAEWGVRACALPGLAGDASAAGAAAAEARDAPGTAYLRRRQAELAAKQAARATAAAEAERLEAGLRPFAVAIRQLPAGGAAAHDEPAPTVTNASYLVAHECARQFVDQAHRLQRQLPALRLRLTGPWPPYSFVEIGPA